MPSVQAQTRYYVWLIEQEGVRHQSSQIGSRSVVGLHGLGDRRLHPSLQHSEQYAEEECNDVLVEPSARWILEAAGVDRDAPEHASIKPREKKDAVVNGRMSEDRRGLEGTVTDGAVGHGAMPMEMGKNGAVELADSAVRHMKETGNGKVYHLWCAIIARTRT